MRTDPARSSPPASPFDPYITEALTLIAEGDDVPLSSLAETMVRQLQWLPGFADVILGVLRTNRLIAVNEWEPGKVHITDRGHRWLAARRESLTIR